VRIDSFLRNAFSASRLVARVTGRSLVASTQAIRLQAEAVLGFFLRTFFISDNVSSTDNDTLDVTKNVSDAGAGSDNDTLDFVKNTTNAAALSDDDVLAIVKALTEQPAFTDAHTFDQTKPLSNSGSVAEDATVTSGKVLADASAFTDNDTLDVTKDVGGDTAQDYCDVTYFLEDYTVGDRLDRIFLGMSKSLLTLRISLTRHLLRMTWMAKRPQKTTRKSTSSRRALRLSLSAMYLTGT
jgi:hypothetical protein